MKRFQSDFSREGRNKQFCVDSVDSKPFCFETTRLRDDELIQLLLTVNVEKEVSFLSLNYHQARTIYNNTMVIEFFEFKDWYTLSRHDDVKQMRGLPILLHEHLARKRFLLLIGDVWYQKEERDKCFNKFLSIMRGKPGSKVILVTSNTEISDLPDSVLHNIFCKLPIKTIIVCKSVSKEWNKLVKDPIFTKLHHAKASVCPILRTLEPRFWPSDLHLIEVNNIDEISPTMKLLHSKILPPQVPLIKVPGEFAVPKFGIVNSCNGLLCVCTTPFNNPIYVCNPITGEYILLPKPHRNPRTNDYIIGREDKSELLGINFVASGFGFSPRSKKYKVMRIFETISDNANIYKINVEVLDLGSRSWRFINVLDKWSDVGLKVTYRQTLLKPREAPYKQSFCVYMNGAVYWLANSHYGPVYISSFNFDREEIFEIPPPQKFEFEELPVGNMRLGVLKDCLYISDVTCYVHFNLWVLKDWYDLSSWTMVLEINNLSLNIWPRGLYQPIKYLDNGELLMFHPSNGLVCYNPKDEKFRYFKIHGFDSDFEMVTYVPSFVSLKEAISEEDLQVQILNVRDVVRVARDWKEHREFALVEQDNESLSATYSTIMAEERSFNEVRPFVSNLCSD